MKKTTFTLIALLYCFNAFTQGQYMKIGNQKGEWVSDSIVNFKPHIDKLFKDAQFIFDGTIKSYKEYHAPDKEVFTVYKVKINKIIRGKLDTGTVEIIERESRCITYDYDGIKNIVDASADDHRYLSTSGIYFCSFSHYPVTGKLVCIRTEKGLSDDSTQYSPPDNSIKLTTINSINGLTLSVAYGKMIKFNSTQEVYQFLQKNGNISIPENNDEKKQPVQPQKDDKKKAGPTGSNASKNQIDYAQRVKNYNNYMQHVQVKMQQNQNKSASNQCKEFFISEYIDGPFKNKVLEIFNPTDSIKSLSGYSIKIFQNGAPTPLDIPLLGNVNPKETHVIAHPQADAAILAKADQVDVKMNFDGNDAIVLNKGTSTYIDKIGEIGVNPGTNGWTVPPSASTKEHDLRRKYPIDQGETDWNQGKNQWNSFPKDSTQNLKQHNNICKIATNDLSFSFANFTESGTLPKYFEFDIMVNANNNSTYFDNCLLRIAYSSSAFGTYLVTNKKITITKGTAYSDVSYIDPDTMAIDQSSSVLGVPFGTYFDTAGTWNRTLVTTTPIQMLHFKIEIQNCNQFSGIDFTDISFTPMFSFYTDNPTEDAVYGNSYPYDNTYYGPALNEELCPFKITTFTSPVYPGTYYIGTTTNEWLLTIQGKGFGSVQGTGNVYFADADTGGKRYIPLNAKDFISWADTKIDIRMPSGIDSFPVPASLIGTPGSGLFYVKRNNDDSVISSTPIDMPYAIKNLPDNISPEGKIRLHFANLNKTDSIDFIFRFDTSITNHPNPIVEPLIRKALRAWLCKTAYYIIIDSKDTTINKTKPDGISVIFMSDSLSKPTAIGETYLKGVNACGDLSGNKIVFPTDIDIAFRQTHTWFFDTTGAPVPPGMSDFYETVLHEIGHALLLRHVTETIPANNDKELMYYASKPGPTAGTDRDTISDDDKAGLIDVLLISESFNLNTSSCNSLNVGTFVLPPEKSCVSVGLPKHLIKTIYFSIYPNPVNSNLTVEFETPTNSNSQFTIFDFTGKEIITIKKKQLSKGTHHEQINTEQLSPGIYLFLANINGNLQTFKIVKM